MRTARRFIGIALQCALVAMSVVGSGSGCDAHASHSAHMAMTGMSMADMPSGDMPMDMPGHTGSGDDADSESDCTFPASFAGCESMASCTQSVLAVGAPVIVASETRSDNDATWFIQQLRSVTRSPESPPPRA